MNQASKDATTPQTETRPRWSGKVIDANGRVGTIELLVGDGGKKSQWLLSLAERGRDPVELKGESDIEVTKEGMRMKSEQEVAKGVKVAWEIDFKFADAKLYAKAAMLGQYVVRAPAEGAVLPLSTGVMVLWQFA